MSMLPSLLSSPWLECLAQTLLHFIWQGALIAVLYALASALASRRTPRERYALGCVAMACLGAAPVVTFAWTAAGAHGIAPIAPIAREATIELPMSLAGTASPISLDSRQLLVLAWMAGVSVLLVRTCGGLIHARRWRLAAEELDPRWQLACQRLAERLGIRALVRLVSAPHVTVPTAIGWLQPVIVFPVSVITGLSAAQVESILAHELAHIRRHDYLINLLQIAAETLLFYHPAVWWISRRIRIEREYCCDDLAVSLCGDPLAYAHALTALEERRSPTLPLAVSSAGGSLMNRIRRLVGMTPLPARGSASATLLTSSLLGLVLVFSVPSLAAPPVRSSSAPALESGDPFAATAVAATAPESDPFAPSAVAFATGGDGKRDGQRCDCCQKCELPDPGRGHEHGAAPGKPKAPSKPGKRSSEKQFSPFAQSQSQSQSQSGPWKFQYQTPSTPAPNFTWSFPKQPSAPQSAPGKRSSPSQPRSQVGQPSAPPDSWFEAKPFAGKAFTVKPFDGKSFDMKSFDGKAFEFKPFDGKAFTVSPFDGKSVTVKPNFKLDLKTQQAPWVQPKFEYQFPRFDQFQKGWTFPQFQQPTAPSAGEDGKVEGAPTKKKAKSRAI